MFHIAVIIIALALLPAAIQVAIPLAGLALSLALAAAAVAALIAGVVFAGSAIQAHPSETVSIVVICAIIAAVFYTRPLWAPIVERITVIMSPIMGRVGNVLAPIILYGAFAFRVCLGLFFGATTVLLFIIPVQDYFKFGYVEFINDLPITIPFGVVFGALAYALLRNIKQDFLEIRNMNPSSVS